MERIAYLYLIDLLSDWEIGHITSELSIGRIFRKDAGTVVVKTFARDRNPVRTVGGLTVIPDLTVDEVRTQPGSLLLLPGADGWTEPAHQPVLDLARTYLSNNKVVAAICGATVGLASAGLLNERRHTSNDLETLQSLPGYKGAERYEDLPAVRDGNLVTASGIAPLEFAREIMAAMDVAEPEVLDHWHGLVKTLDPVHLKALM